MHAVCKWLKPLVPASASLCKRGKGSHTGKLLPQILLSLQDGSPLPPALETVPSVKKPNKDLQNNQAWVTGSQMLTQDLISLSVPKASAASWISLSILPASTQDKNALNRYILALLIHTDVHIHSALACPVLAALRDSN